MKFDAKRTLLAGSLAVMSSGFFAVQASAEQNHMDSAIDALRTARSELQMSTHNKGGHRLRAISLIDEAIGEVRQGREDADDHRDGDWHHHGDHDDH